MKKKISIIQIIRHAVQLVLFFLLPGLYAMAFSELKEVYQMILKGNFNFIQVLPDFVELLTVIFATIILGRFFCGWACAFGAYNDLIHEISRNVFKIKYKVDAKVDSVLKYLKYAVLAFIIVISWTFGSTVLSGSSPWDAFAQITDFPQVISTVAIGFILLVLITAGAVFIERFFCRYLCPLGAVFSLLSKISLFKINMPKDKCGKCMACTNSCSMGIELYKLNEARGGECINCLKCVEVCPRKNAVANVLDEGLSPALASSIAIAVFAGIYGFNSVGAFALTDSGISSPKESTSINSSVNNPSGQYKDGTYIGTGTGFRGGATRVAVTIKNGRIADINTVSSQDTPKFYSRAENVITGDIISSQSTTVDTVSGATFSCEGIISAVEDALAQAVADAATDTALNSNSSSSTVQAQDNTTENNNQTTNNSSIPDTNSTTSSNSNTGTSTVNKSGYKDGTYTGSGTGFRGGTTKVSVTVENGRITNIETVSSQDTPRFYYRAESTTTGNIVSSQSTSVDTVSGATYSSRGIINAVANALNKAK